MFHNRCRVGALRALSSSDRLERQHDDFGFDPEFTDRVQGILLWFYRNYWRVEVDGIRNVPARGRALLVANHAGLVPYDGAMIRAAILAEHPSAASRMMVVDWAFAMPFTNICDQDRKCLLIRTTRPRCWNATSWLEFSLKVSRAHRSAFETATRSSAWVAAASSRWRCEQDRRSSRSRSWGRRSCIL